MTVTQINPVTTDIPSAPQPRRPWNRHAFYMSDRMAAIAAAIAKREHEQSGRQVGAGQIIDRAMRRYVADLLTPEEVAEMVRAATNPNGRTHE